MQSKATKNTRAPNTEEKLFQRWIKTEKCFCDACGRRAPLICHHAMGKSFRHEGILNGHWFCLGLCQICDNVVTHGSRRKFKDKFDLQSVIWAKSYIKYVQHIERNPCPKNVRDSIMRSNE